MSSREFCARCPRLPGVFQASSRRLPVEHEGFCSTVTLPRCTYECYNGRCALLPHGAKLPRFGSSDARNRTLRRVRCRLQNATCRRQSTECRRQYADCMAQNKRCIPWPKHISHTYRTCCLVTEYHLCPHHYLLWSQDVPLQDKRSHNGLSCDNVTCLVVYPLDHMRKDAHKSESLKSEWEFKHGKRGIVDESANPPR